MKYILYEKDQIKKEMVYCNNHTDNPETPEEIARAMTPFYFMGKFHLKDHEPILNPIVNVDNIFILGDMNGTYLYQVCGKVSDCCDAIVPNLYYIRKIGILVNYI